MSIVHSMCSRNKVAMVIAMVVTVVKEAVMAIPHLVAQLTPAPITKLVGSKHPMGRILFTLHSPYQALPFRSCQVVKIQNT